MHVIPQLGDEAAGRPAPFTADDFPADPELQCDVVMKGGITSGVVYPLAVCELATTYRLRAVGGASAGAIAAAVAAAAELGRRSASGSGGLAGVTGTPAAPPAAPPGEPAGSVPEDENAHVVLPAGYLGLSRFPALLTEARSDGRSLLFHLFRPQPSATRLFGLVTGAIELVARLPKDPAPAEVRRTVAALARGLVRRTRRRSVLGALLGLLLVVLAVVALATLPAGAGPATVVALVLAVLVGALVALLGLLAGAVSGLISDLWALPGIGFGLTSGRGEKGTELALTPWLDRRLQELAGRPYDQPLTMGDLWEQEIKLQAMTTNLSRAQPMVMPWNDDAYFFEPAEFEALFGSTVTRAMSDPAAAPDPPTDPGKAALWAQLMAHRGTKQPFPRPDRLPVIVATRMSLSFPLLIAAVRLYSVDWDHATNRRFKAAVESGARPEKLEWDVNWFSDGGLTSNLPVQFFDSQLPTRPTFAIDLAPFGSDRVRSRDERLNSHLPDQDQRDLQRRTTRWTATKPLGQLVSFGTALVNTARTWVDQASLVMPGYRDRVVTVFQDEKTEGGLNLSMPKDVVDGLSLRGRFAAQRLVRRYGPEGGWPNHRWIRFRTATAALSDWLAGFERGFVADPDFYGGLLDGTSQQPSYALDQARLVAVRQRIAGLRAEIGEWEAAPADAFVEDRPMQPPVLRLVPPSEAFAGGPPSVAGLQMAPGPGTGADLGEAAEPVGTAGVVAPGGSGEVG